jgi:hypothetical protein
MINANPRERLIFKPYDIGVAEFTRVGVEIYPMED